MTTRQELISNALRQRFTSLGDKELDPASFGRMSDFISRVQKRFHLDFKELPHWDVPISWANVECDCLTAVQVLALGDPLPSTPVEPPSSVEFLRSLQAEGVDCERRFKLLTGRYSYPLNFTAPSEHAIREHVLERLMVQDRRRLEGRPLSAVEVDDFLLKLNLVAIFASCTTDLRFLDALNYYYEVSPSYWRTPARNRWLLITYLAFYARALALFLAI